MQLSPVKRQIYIFLAVLIVAQAVGLQGWRSLLNNFAQQAGIDGLGIGFIQGIREIPGFLAFLVVYILFIIKEHRLAALSIAFMGTGIAMAGFFPSTTGLICTTLIMSFGFHYFETCNMSLVLQHFDHKTAPLVVGRLRGLSCAGNLAIGGIIWILASTLSFKMLFLVVGVPVFLTGLWYTFYNIDEKPAVSQHQKQIFRLRYWLFYTLTFLAGARRQIFVAFAVFLLVERFGFHLRDIAILFIINNVIGWFSNPFIGKAIARFGERTILTIEYSGLVIVFLLYGITDSKLVAAFLYIADHILFSGSIAIRTFFQKMADPKDIGPSMAMGFTINHISAVLLPIAGGVLWLTDPAIVFYTGAALAMLSLLFVQCIKLYAHKKDID